MVLMALLHVLFSLAGSALVLLSLPKLTSGRRRRIIAEKLRLVTEALEHAEETVVRFEERHDRILHLMNSQYLCYKGMEEALHGARNAMNEALQFSVALRRMQMEILTAYPYGGDFYFFGD